MTIISKTLDRPVAASINRATSAVWAAVDGVSVEKRGVFLERVFARLQLHHGFTDADLDDAVCVALTGLIQSAA